MRQSALGFSPEATYPTSWSRPVMHVSLAWLELDMRTVLGTRATDARGCRRRGGTITVRSPPGAATRGLDWPDCARDRKSVAAGERVSVRVDLWVRRRRKKKI